MAEIVRERERQDTFVENGTFPWNCSSPTAPPEYKLAVLSEEMGEVASAMLGDMGDKRAHDHVLRKELLQVAAVAVAWAESLT